MAYINHNLSAMFIVLVGLFASPCRFVKELKPVGTAPLRKWEFRASCVMVVLSALLVTPLQAPTHGSVLLSQQLPYG